VSITGATEKQFEAGSFAIFDKRGLERHGDVAMRNGVPIPFDDYLKEIIEISFTTGDVLSASVPPDHRIVSVSSIESAIDALEKIYSKQITMNNHSHRDWLRKRIDVLRSVIEKPE
jgi:hypothetical protein